MSDGVVTFARLPLVTCDISLLLSLEVLEHGVEAVEPPVHSCSKPTTQSWMGFSASPLIRYRRLPSVLAHVHRSHFAEHLEVLGDLRLGEPELRDEVVDGTLPVRERVQDRAPPGLGDGVERVRGGGCSGHAEEYTHIGICQDGDESGRRGAVYRA